MSDLKLEYDRNGFVVVRNFLPVDEFATLRAELDRYIEQVVPTLDDGDAFYHDRSRPETLKQLQHMGRDPFFGVYGDNPRWKELATELIGEPCNAQEPEWFNKPAGTNHVTPPHQDNFYFCLRPANVATFWLALDDVDDENGCLRYVTGSHLKGIRPHNSTKILGFSQGIMDYGDGDRQREVAIHLSPGDVVAHHGNTIHRADANTSNIRHRRAFAMVFRGESCTHDEAARERYNDSLKHQHQEMGLNV